MNTWYDEFTSGKYHMDDWRNMKLKTDLKEGKDYVLVSSLIWYYFLQINLLYNNYNRSTLWRKYLALPVINLMILPGVAPSENYLKTPYKGGYPDISPVTLIFCIIKEGEVLQEKTILLSLKTTCKMLREIISKQVESSTFELSVDDGVHVLSHNDTKLEDTDETIGQKGIADGTIIKIFIPNPKLMSRMAPKLPTTSSSSSSSNNKGTADRASERASERGITSQPRNINKGYKPFHVLQEEIFEGVGDDDDDDSSEPIEKDAAGDSILVQSNLGRIKDNEIAEIKERESKQRAALKREAEAEAEAAAKLESEFQETYKRSESGSYERLEFAPQPVGSIIGALEEMLMKHDI